MLHLVFFYYHFTKHPVFLHLLYVGLSVDNLEKKVPNQAILRFSSHTEETNRMDQDSWVHRIT